MNRELSSTPYDDVYRTMMTDCPELVIPLINEMFTEHYERTAAIRHLKNEHLVNELDGTQKKIVTDTLTTVVGSEQKKYHIECQSTADGSILFRMFEYDSRIALESGIINGRNMLTVNYPYAGILHLRHGKRTPTHLKTVIRTPDGTVSYRIKVLRLKQYSLAEIFEKNLLILIPFYIFIKENLLKSYNKDESKLEELKQEYGYICNRLSALCDAGQLSVKDKSTILDMSRKVLVHIVRKYPKVREGVEEILGGKVLEYETKTIYNAGEAAGEIMLGKLIQFLLRDGRMQEIQQAASDEAERKRLYREYGMID